MVGGVTDEDLVNDHDRTKMCDWYYARSDFLGIDRATAGRSLTLLERFMAAASVRPESTRPRNPRGAEWPSCSSGSACGRST